MTEGLLAGERVLWSGWPARARRTVDARIRAGGFSSAKDLGMLLNLPPDAIDQIRDMAIFLPGRQRP